MRTSTPVPGGESIAGDGTIPIPTNVPEAVQKVVAGANEIADFPYVFGGGHVSFIDNAYDCSGSVSYALAAGGLIGQPETSGELESWGAPGPGPLHHGVRQRRAHVHVRGRDHVQHRGPQRRLRLALAGVERQQQRLRRTPLAGAVGMAHAPSSPCSRWTANRRAATTSVLACDLGRLDRVRLAADRRAVALRVQREGTPAARRKGPAGLRPISPRASRS